MGSVTTMNKKELTKLMSYFIMGDGGVYYQENKPNCSFIMNMKEENIDYVMWVKNVLEEFTGTTLKTHPDYNTDGCNRKPQVRLQSGMHPFLTTLRERIYVDKYKSIDPHALTMLDWEAIAILYMCDGSLCEDKPNPKKGLKNSSWNLTLNLKRLSYGDQLLLKKALKDKLDCEFNINKQNKYYYLRLRTKDIIKFCEGVAPYILPSFLYKIRVISPSNEGGEIV